MVFVPEPAAASYYTEIVLNPGNGASNVTQGQATYAAVLSTTGSCGAAQAFADLSHGAIGVADSTLSSCGVSYTYGAYADAQAFDHWACAAGCSLLPASLNWVVSMSGTAAGDSTTESTFLFTDTISVNFQTVYTVGVNVRYLGGTLTATAGLSDTGLVDGTPGVTTYPVTISGNTFSVNLLASVLLPPLGFSSVMEATAVSNGSIDVYDPVQTSFTPQDPTVQFTSDGGDIAGGNTAPEPASFLLLGTALAALACRRHFILLR
jgi:hypothetical protein